MADIIDDGWIHLYDASNSLKLGVEKFVYKLIKKGTNIHLEGGVNIYIPVHVKYIYAVASGIWITSVSDIENYQLYLDTWLSSGTFNLKFTYDGTNFLKLDGTNTIFPVAVKGDLGMIEKVSNGDQGYFYVDRLILEGCGTAS